MRPKTLRPIDNERLSARDLREIAKNAATVSYPRNAIVVQEGDATDSLYIVVRGKVEIYVGDAAGKKVTLNTAGPGEYFGEITLDGGPRSASVITSQASEFLVVPSEDFSSFIERNPRFTKHLVLKLIGRVRALTANVRSLALMDVYGRVARLLLESAREINGTLIIENRPTHRELAAKVGASREMISRILSDLVRGGYITMDRTKIYIVKKLPRGW